jgi:uroporphyrinogen decarboxylase
MVEGGGSKSFARIKHMMYGAPRDLHRLLDLLARATIAYLNAQIDAGAQAVMLFDTWGGVLTPLQYREFSLRYMARVVESLIREAGGRRVPSVVFHRLRRRRRGLDHRPRGRAPQHRWPRGVAGEP